MSDGIRKPDIFYFLRAGSAFIVALLAIILSFMLLFGNVEPDQVSDCIKLVAVFWGATALLIGIKWPKNYHMR